MIHDPFHLLAPEYIDLYFKPLDHPPPHRPARHIEACPTGPRPRRLRRRLHRAQLVEERVARAQQLRRRNLDEAPRSDAALGAFRGRTRGSISMKENS